MLSSKKIVQSKFPDATIRKCESALYRGVEFRVSWNKDGNGNYDQATGKRPTDAWMNAKNQTELK